MLVDPNRYNQQKKRIEIINSRSEPMMAQHIKAHKSKLIKSAKINNRIIVDMLKSFTP